MSRLEGRHIDAAFFNGLLNPDPVRLLLRWIDDPSTVQHELAGAAWDALVAQCKADYGFDPAAAGVIEAARRLGAGEGAWQQVWQRFRESPAEYPDCQSRLRRRSPRSSSCRTRRLAWPQDNESREESLRAALTDLSTYQPRRKSRDRRSWKKSTRSGAATCGRSWVDTACLGVEQLAEMPATPVAESCRLCVAQISERYAARDGRSTALCCAR